MGYELNNGRITLLNDGVLTSQDAVTMNQLSTIVCEMNSLWVNGSQQLACQEYCGTSNTNSSGVATFYLTTNGLSNGPAIFSAVHKASFNAWIDDFTTQYLYGGYTVSGDLKTLTITAKIAVVTLGILNINLAPSGRAINIRIKGNVI